MIERIGKSRIKLRLLASKTEWKQKKITIELECRREGERESGDDNKNKWQITNARVSALIIRVISFTFAHTHTQLNAVNLYR